MQRSIVSDTSCLILLHKVGRIPLLKSLFGKITITSTIANEFGQTLPDFVSIEDPEDKIYQQILEGFLDPGEASAIAFALEQDDCLLIMDDTKGRREARKLKLNVTGTIGILIIAKEKGLIKSFTEVINEISQTDFRISESLILEAKRRCGE
jgi:predicted nucleic acid-binding protein